MKRYSRYMIYFFGLVILAMVLLLPMIPGAIPAFNKFKGVIVIDAGHGGFDGGATGLVTGVHEDALNLSVAKKLQDLFEKNRYRVIMTREDENAVGATKDKDMARRREIIKNANADIVISIHMNKFPQTSVSGPQVFFYEKSTEGETLAKIIQEQLNTMLEPVKQRVEHPEDYYILCSGNCPAVIVECGFLSNEREEGLLQDDDYQTDCAKAIYKGATMFLEQGTENSLSEPNQ